MMQFGPEDVRSEKGPRGGMGNSSSGIFSSANAERGTTNVPADRGEGERGKLQKMAKRDEAFARCSLTVS